MVMAYLDWEALACSGCGGYLPETTDPDNEGRYDADAPHRCHRCTAIARERHEYDDDSVPFPSALVVWPTHLRRRNG